MKNKIRVWPMLVILVVQIFVFMGQANNVSAATEKPNKQVEKSTAPAKTKKPTAKKKTDSVTDDVKDNAKELLDGIREKSKKEFDSILDKADDVKTTGESAFWRKFMKVHSVVKDYAPILIILSVTFGAIIAFFARLNKTLRRWAISTLCIGVPLVILILVYGMPYIHSAFS